MPDSKTTSGFRSLLSTLLPLALALGTLEISAAGSLASGATAREHWVPLGPIGGAIGLLAQSPSDPQRLYAATERFGLFRSRDGGGSWQSISRGIAGTYFQQIAVAPEDPDFVLASTYGGTSPGHEVHQIWRSQDGGVTWTPASRPPKNGRYTLAPYDLKFLSGDPRTAYAATDKGIFRSADGGATWDAWALSDLIVTTFSRSEQAPAVWLAATTDPVEFNNVILRSDDGGASWRPTPSLGGFGPSEFPRRLSFRDGAFYVLWGGGLYRSTDVAATWSLAARLPETYAVDFAFAPSGSIYAATGAGVYVSNDGVHWSPPEVFSSDQGSPRDGINQLVVVSGGPRPAGETVVAAGQRGLWRSTDQGSSWRAASRGITAHDVLRLAVLADPLETVIGNFEDGIHRTDRTSNMWQRLPPQAGYGFPILAADPHHPGRLYALADAGLGVSEDRGKSWRTVGEILHSDVFSLTVDPVHRDVLYAGITLGQASSENGFAYRSTDGGATWTEFLSFDYLLDVAFDPTHPNVGFFLSYGGLFKSVDGGEHWAPLPNFRDQVGGFTTSMLFDSRSRAIYVGTDESGIFRSTDSGRTFRRVTGGLPRLPDGHYPSVAALVQDAAGDLYAGLVRAGVFRLERGRGWKAVNTDLPLSSFYGPLVADPARPGRLYAGTVGASVLRLEER